MFDIKRLFGNKNKDLPKVVYKDKKVKTNILEWLEYLKLDSIEEVLSEIGFKSEDIIYLYDCTDNSFYYSVNKDKLDKNNIMRLDFSSKLLIFGNNEVVYKYSCYPGNYAGKSVVIGSRYYEKRLSEDIACTCYYSDNRFSFLLYNDDYDLSLELHFKYVMNGFENGEDKILEEYLSGLTLPVVLEDVYKKICEICDVNSFRTFELHVKSRLEEDHRINKITDLISLLDGELNKFVRTKNGKTVSFKGDRKWSCEVESDLVSSVEYSDTGRELTYKFTFNDEKNRVSDEELINLKNSALEEVEDTKKLARIMISKR